MKKNILIILLIVLSLFSMLYAKIKASENERIWSLSSEIKARNEQLELQILQIQVTAEEAAAEANRQYMLAQQAIEDCKSKKP